jgi:hypothetical protein
MAIYSICLLLQLCKVKQKAIAFLFVYNLCYIQKRSRTKLKDIVYAKHPYFNGLSLRNTSKALSRFVKKSHTAIIDCWILKYTPKKLSYLIKKDCQTHN